MDIFKEYVLCAVINYNLLFLQLFSVSALVPQWHAFFSGRCYYLHPTEVESSSKVLSLLCNII